MHALQAGHVLAGARRRRELEEHRLAPPGRLHPVDLLQLLHPALHLRGVRGPRLEALDELDLLGEHRLLALELRLLLGLGQRALLLVELEVAGICGQCAAVDLHHLGDDAVHELAVVRGHQQCALVALEELLQPDEALQVEMVARLVQQHDVGAHQQDARQRHAHLPAARQRADVAVHHLLAEAQAGEHLARPPLERIAVELLEARLHLAVALDQALHLVRAIRIPHGRFELLELGRHRAHRAGAVHHLRHGAATRHLAHVLAEVADGHAAIDRHLALVGMVLARDHPEQRGLAGAVGADETDFLALLERRRGLDEEELVAVLLADAVETNHVCAKPGTSCGRPYAMRRAGRKSVANPAAALPQSRRREKRPSPRRKTEGRNLLSARLAAARPASGHRSRAILRRVNPRAAGPASMIGTELSVADD